MGLDAAVGRSPAPCACRNPVLLVRTSPTPSVLLRVSAQTDGAAEANAAAGSLLTSALWLFGDYLLRHGTIFLSELRRCRCCICDRMGHSVAGPSTLRGSTVTDNAQSDWLVHEQCSLRRVDRKDQSLKFSVYYRFGACHR